MQFKVIPRTDTWSKWERENPILRRGEIIAVRDKNNYRYKLGDGTSRFSELEFCSIEKAIFTGTIYTRSGGHSVQIRLPEEKV